MSSGSRAHEGVPHDVGVAGAGHARERGRDRGVRRGRHVAQAKGEPRVGQTAGRERHVDEAARLGDDHLPERRGGIVHELRGAPGDGLRDVPRDGAAVASVLPGEAVAHRALREGGEDGAGRVAGDGAGHHLLQRLAVGGPLGGEREGEGEHGARREQRAQRAGQARADVPRTGRVHVGHRGHVQQLLRQQLLEAVARQEHDLHGLRGRPRVVDPAAIGARGRAPHHHRGLAGDARELGVVGAAGLLEQPGDRGPPTLPSDAAIVRRISGRGSALPRREQRLFGRSVLHVPELHGRVAPGLGIGVAQRRQQEGAGSRDRPQSDPWRAAPAPAAGAWTPRSAAAARRRRPRPAVRSRARPP